METPEFPTNIFGKYFQSTVYEPSEDTFILLDALEQDLTFIRNLKPLICVEIGCGSGAVITSLAKSIGNDSFYLAVDINPEAIKCTQECLKFNIPSDSNVVQLINTNLNDGIRLKDSVDLLIFNPPYVPTINDEVDKGLIEATWAGGDHGRIVIDRFIKKTLTPMLNSNGLAYLVVIEQNNLSDLILHLEKIGFQCKNVLKRKCGIETLSVLRICRLK